MLLTSPTAIGRAGRGGSPGGTQKVLDLTSISHDKHPTAPPPHIMVVKIRLARFGRRKAPFYNIVVAQARFVPLALGSFIPVQTQAPLTYGTGQRGTANQLKS